MGGLAVLVGVLVLAVAINGGTDGFSEDDDGRSYSSAGDLAHVYFDIGGYLAPDDPVRAGFVPEPGPVLTTAPVGPSDAEPVLESGAPPPRAPEPAVPTDIEAAICSVGWPDCAKALRVARCESGPDYYAGFSAHVGTFQIAPLHSWRFDRLGLDYWVHGDDPYYNSAVAYWIYKERLAATGNGWGAWPVCGLR